MHKIHTGLVHTHTHKENAITGKHDQKSSNRDHPLAMDQHFKHKQPHFETKTLESEWKSKPLQQAVKII